MKSGDIVADRYRLEAKLGMGGMGTVWSAEHIQTGRSFALKIMHATVAANDDSRQRFLKEAKASARINHPNVIDVLDVGELPEGALFMAMELLDGMALADAMRMEPALSLRELLLVLRDACSALAAAHAVGIIHRDVKPANVFLHRDKGSGQVRPKVLDFGVSKFAFLEESATHTGSLLGSPRYMSPEQARSAAQADARADVWSVGVILFEALTGTFPHDGDSFSNLVVAIATTAPKSLAQMAPHLPRPLTQLVDDCLRPRDQRLASCDLLGARMEELLRTIDLSLLPCMRGKNKKSVPRPPDFQVRSPAEAIGARDPRGSVDHAPRVIEEPSTSPTTTRNAPGSPAAGNALFGERQPTETRTLPRLEAPERAPPVRPRTVPMGQGPTQREVAEMMAQAQAEAAKSALPPAPPPAPRPAAPGPSADGGEATRLHARPSSQQPTSALASPDGQTRLIAMPSHGELSISHGPTHNPNRMAQPSGQPPPDQARTLNHLDLVPAQTTMLQSPIASRMPYVQSSPSDPRDHLIESVSTFGVERQRLGNANSNAPPHDPSGAHAPIRRNTAGAAIAIGMVSITAMVVGVLVFTGRVGGDPAAAPAAPALEVEPPPVAPPPPAEPAPPDEPAVIADGAPPLEGAAASAAASAEPPPEPAASASADASPPASAAPAPSASASAPGQPPSRWGPSGGQAPNGARPGPMPRPAKPPPVSCDKDPIGCLGSGI